MDAQMLKACMTYHGKTQEDVGKAIGVDRSTFWRRMNDGDFRSRKHFFSNKKIGCCEHPISWEGERNITSSHDAPGAVLERLRPR